MKQLIYVTIFCALMAGAVEGVPKAQTAAPVHSPAALVELPMVAEMVGDLDPQAFSEGFSANWLLQPLGDGVYFIGSDQTHGRELWRSDGTPEGTTLVEDIWPGPDSSWTNDLTASGEYLYFAADDGAHGFELWVSSPSGAALVGDFEPGVRNFAPEVGSLQPQQLTPFGEGDLLFTSNQDSQMWRANPGEAPVLIHVAGSNDWIKILATDPAGERFFFGSYNQHDPGVEASLWISDGTPAGTRLIHTFAPVPGGYYQFFEGLMLNGKLIFVLNNPAAGVAEIWTSDGSESGTQVVYSGTIFYYITMKPIYSLGRVFFTAGTYGTDLWVTDGTPSGTYPVASDLLDIKNLTDLNGQAVFTTDVLWVSDGTPAGTQVIDTFQGSPDIGMEVVNGRAVFASIDSEYVGDTLVFTSTLWATDATPGGIQALYSVAPDGEGISIFRSPASDGSHIYYFNQGTDGHDELWRTDGTLTGTVMVEQIDNLINLAWAGSRLFFTSSIVPFEPWENPTSNLGISDGTPAGTGLVMPGQEPEGSSSPSQFTLAGGPGSGRVFFTAEDAAHGRELWAANPDGSDAMLVKDLNPGNASSNPLELTVLGDTLFFTAELAGGRALWKSDGTLEGTVQLGEFNYPYELTVFDGQVYFLTSSHLWKTSGGAPEIVYTPGEWMSLAEAEVAGNQLFLAQWDGDGLPMTLYVSDGTSAGTTSVRVFGKVLCSKGGCTSPTLSQLTGADDRLYFAASPNDGAIETDVWTSDGTPGGTLQLSGLSDTEDASDPSLMTTHGDELFFVEDDGRSGIEPWKSDGTPQGTALLSDIFLGSSRSGPANSGPTELTWVGDVLYFAATDPSGGRELWRYHAGRDPALQRVADVSPGDGRTNPSQLAAVGDVPLYAAYDSEAGNELWVSGGSAVTTRRLADLRLGPDSSNPRDFVVIGEWALFQANDGIHGAELWRLPLTALSRVPQAEIGAQGGVLASYLDGVRYAFGAGTFGETVTVSHTVEASPPALPGEGWVVEVFEVSGTQAPAMPYTLAVEYMAHQTGPAIQNSLKLLRWDGSTWVEESSTLDLVTGTITAHPGGWGLFAVVGDTREVYLPVIY